MLEFLLGAGGSKLPYLRDTGPGPTQPIAGTMTRGFFGEVSSKELVDAESLNTLLEFNVGLLVNPDTAWLKFYRDGQILFIPKLPIRSNVSYRSLYYHGLVYGTDDIGTFPLETSTLQDRTVTIKGYVFRVRLIGGAPTDPFEGRVSTQSPDTSGSEWDDLMYPVTNLSYTQIDPEVWENYSSSELGGGNEVWLKETIASNTNLRLTKITSTGQNYGRQLTANYFWKPVLELVRGELLAPKMISVGRIAEGRFGPDEMLQSPDRLKASYIPDHPEVLFGAEELLKPPVISEAIPVFTPDASIFLNTLTLDDRIQEPFNFEVITTFTPNSFDLASYTN